MENKNRYTNQGSYKFRISQIYFIFNHFFYYKSSCKKINYCGNYIFISAPNHHVMLDKGSSSINDNFDLIGHVSGKLTVDPNHKINKQNFAYHRTLHDY